MKLYSRKPRNSTTEHTKEYVTVILTTNDINTKKFEELIGEGIDILVLPETFRNSANPVICCAKSHVELRTGQIIYV